MVCCIILLFTFPSATDDGTENVFCAFTDEADVAMTTGIACSCSLALMGLETTKS